jgi:phospholipase/carboxylesterase
LTETQLDANLGFVHRYLPSKTKGARILLVLHGTGGDEDDMLPLAKTIDPQAAILSPRGKVLENGMPRFFRRYAEGVFDIEDLKFRTQELGDFVVNASKKYGFDSENVVALGYSNGANIGASLLLLRPEILKGTVLFRAMLPLNPNKQPDLKGKKVFLSAGKYDSIIPQEGTRALVKLLETSGAEVTLNWEESTHSLKQSEVEKAKTWLRDE